MVYVKTGHTGVSAFSQIVSRVGLQSGESLRSDVYDRIAGSPHVCTIPLNWIDAKTKMRRNNTKTMSLFCGKVTAVFSFHFARVSTTRKKKKEVSCCALPTAASATTIFRCTKSAKVIESSLRDPNAEPASFPCYTVGQQDRKRDRNKY